MKWWVTWLGGSHEVVSHLARGESWSGGSLG